MHPVLFTLRGFPVPTFGLVVLVGVFLGIWLQKREGARLGYDPRKVEEVALLTILASWAGSRGVYLLQNPHEIAGGAGIFQSGGHVLYGGVAAGVTTAFVLARRAGIPGRRLVDIFSPGVTLGFAIGRIGCTLAGCDYGRAADAPHWWTLTFTDPRCLVPAPLLGQPLWPSQPLMALSHLATFAVIYPARRRLTPWPGALLALTLAVEPPLRFAIEFIRGDPDRGFVGPLSTSQAIAAVLAPVSLYALVKLTRGPASPPPGLTTTGPKSNMSTRNPASPVRP
jgi:phosphatidylglycerol:prolipoprotein diacylglycerol transferase